MIESNAQICFPFLLVSRAKTNSLSFDAILSTFKHESGWYKSVVVTHWLVAVT